MWEKIRKLFKKPWYYNQTGSDLLSTDQKNLLDKFDNEEDFWEYHKENYGERWLETPKGGAANLLREKPKSHIYYEMSSRKPKIVFNKESREYICWSVVSLNTGAITRRVGRGETPEEAYKTWDSYRVVWTWCPIYMRK